MELIPPGCAGVGHADDQHRVYTWSHHGILRVPLSIIITLNPLCRSRQLRAAQGPAQEPQQSVQVEQSSDETAQASAVHQDPVRETDVIAADRYLKAVREFADNVLKYGRDTYGPKHTPLFVDGVNIHTHEPVKWISPRGDALTTTETEEWILSNFASQQTLLRTLDGLSAITGDPKYRAAALQATKYALENLRVPNGLFYWGQLAAYDALRDKVWSDANRHSLKVNYPYYELMWQVNPEETQQLIEVCWSAHIIDWSNLDFNRTAIALDIPFLETTWDHAYKGGPIFFKSKTSWAQGFFHTGTSLAHAATTLYRLSGQKQPLVWSKRLIQRFVDTRHPNTGISAHKYNQPQRLFVGGGIEEHFNDPRVGVFPFHPFVYPFIIDPFKEIRNFNYLEDIKPHQWISVLLMGEVLGEQGKEFSQWALEELTAWGKASYQPKGNVFMPVLTDGTPIAGIVLEKDSTAYPKGSIAEPLFANAEHFWLYATAYKTTGDAFMWQMTRSIVQGNNLGDIGEVAGQAPALNRGATNSNVYNLLAFLELYRSTMRREFLYMARRIADNILAKEFHKGFFVVSKDHIYTRFNCFEPLAVLHLTAAIESRWESVPRIWPESPIFVPSYRYKEIGNDHLIIYTVTKTSEPPLSLQEAAAIGDVNAVRTLLENGTYVDSVEDAWQKTALIRATISGHKEVVRLLLAHGADVDRTDASGKSGRRPLMIAIYADDKDMVELLIRSGADVNLADRGNPPLLHAVIRGNAEIVKLLLDHGAKVYPSVYIRLAASRGRREVAELFLSRGVDSSSLHMAVCAGDLAAIKSLIAQGGDVNAKDEEGWTPLFWATCMGRTDVIELLIDEGADLTITDNSQNTALHKAVELGNCAVARVLIDHGADINAKGRGRLGLTPLHVAIPPRNKEMVELLIRSGADMNIKNSRGLTPMDVAKARGFQEMVDLLNKLSIESSETPMDYNKTDSERKADSESPDKKEDPYSASAGLQDDTASPDTSDHRTCHLPISPVQMTGDV